MLAIAAMSHGVQAVFFAVAVILFVLSAIKFPEKHNIALDFTALGLAVAFFVFFWMAWAAAA